MDFLLIKASDYQIICITFGIFFKLECLPLTFWVDNQLWESAGYSVDNVSWVVADNF
jgi:hypothetical protein